jgi:hypothetical protein
MAIKVAYPTLSGTQRTDLATKLVRSTIASYKRANAMMGYGGAGGGAGGGMSMGSASNVPSAIPTQSTQTYNGPMAGGMSAMRGFA